MTALEKLCSELAEFRNAWQESEIESAQKIAELRQSICEITNQQHRIYRILEGNGQKGIIERLTRIESLQEQKNKYSSQSAAVESSRLVSRSHILSAFIGAVVPTAATILIAFMK